MTRHTFTRAPLLLAAALLVCAGSAAGSTAVGAQTPRGTEDDLETPEVRSLDLEGVRSVEKDELLESIATDESRCRGLLFRPFCLVSRSQRWWRKAYLDRTELRRDVLRIRVFYFKRGFREATVDTTVARAGDDAVKVTFRIDEGPPTVVSELTVARTDSIISPRRLRRRLQLREGEPFDLLALDSTLVLLQQDYWNRGYADVVIDTATSVDAATRTARVEIRPDPRWRTRVGSIEVRGEDGVSERTIRRSLTVGVGDIYRRTDVLESQRRLYESNLFRRATIIIPPEGDSLKQLVVTVDEAPPRLARISGGFNTVDFVQAEGRFTQYNFFGGARRLELRGAIGNLFATSLNGRGAFADVVPGVDDGSPFLEPTWQLSAEIVQPWLFSPRNSAGINAFANRRVVPGVVVDRAIGAGASVTREIVERAPLSATYRFEVTTVDAEDLYFCASFGVCDPETVTALKGRQNLSPIGLQYTIDRSNRLFSPTRGFRAEGSLEHASAFTLSDFRYNRGVLDATYYYPLRRGRGAWVLASHARVGWVRALASTAIATGVGDTDGIAGDVLHPRKRFYAGGARSVRGYGENQLGPRILTVPASKLAQAGCDTSSVAGVAACDTSPTADTAAPANKLADRDFTARPVGGNSLLEGSVELRFPVWDKLGGAVFVDGAFVGKGSLRDVTSGQGALTPGFGVRYDSPVGAIRVDVGINPSAAEELPVFSEATQDGQRVIVQTRGLRTYDPGGSGGGLTGVLRRLTLHLSIGQAY